MVAFLATTWCRHYRYEQKIARMTWKIDHRDLLMAESEAEALTSDKTVRFIIRITIFIITTTIITIFIFAYMTHQLERFFCCLSFAVVSINVLL